MHNVPAAVGASSNAASIGGAKPEHRSAKMGVTKAPTERTFEGLATLAEGTPPREVRRAAANTPARSRTGSQRAWAQGLSQRSGGRVRAPLDRLAVRQISSRYLSQDERIEIADLRQSELSLRAIAGRLGRAPSTISPPIGRITICGGDRLSTYL
jgi:hypothetical protein